MFVSYENDEIRECCLLLRPSSLNSGFSNDEIKEIRAIIADLRAAPKLVDCPLKYVFHREEGTLEIERGSLKIIGKIISKDTNPAENHIDRMKIVRILNVGIQSESVSRPKYN
ncbi:hypothetical protein [Pleomorphovibrio marinus]|uniref:hypothetical protein n=1 Tax=Pleomorphovibrio marinus TaxID=2164132 RepID=UPI000E0B7DE6|nr:hypothetical protein [Pleomorphovibrio marinus]